MVVCATKFPQPEPLTAGAELVDIYRYKLWRCWDVSLPWALWVMLNPSIADAAIADPTLRRCIGFSKRWGYGGLVLTNLFALISTDPKGLLTAEDPVGPQNDATILEMAETLGGPIICAWGANGSYRYRDQAVVEMLSDFELVCLGRTSGGQPKHPLRLAANTPLIAL